MQRGRNVHRLASRRARPAIALANEHALAHQAADDLLDEQRIAPGARRDEMLDLGEGVPVHRAEQTAHERPRLVGGERGEPDDGLRGPGDQRRARVGAMREQHHQAPVRQMVDDVSQQVHRGSVGPVEILHDDQKRLLLQPPLDQRARGQRDLALELLGLEVAGPRLARTPST